MKQLMMMGIKPMDEATDSSGEGGGGDGTTPPAENNAGDEGGEGGEGEEKPFLGDTKSGEEKPGEGKEGTEGEKPKAATEEDYLKAVVKDDEVLGKDTKMEIDSALVKALIPKAQELGVTPDQMKALANHLAKAQIEQAKEFSKSRIEYFEKMKAESLQKYTQKDFEQINKGIDKWFKPNGVMNNVIRNSELGADPEFLALMHHLGEAVKEDGLSGAGSGSGSGGGDGNGIDGLSKLW